MMRALKVKTIILIAGVILATQAFAFFSWNVPVTASTLPSAPVISELSIIDPDTYDSAKTARSENSSQKSTEFTDFVNSSDQRR